MTARKKKAARKVTNIVDGYQPSFDLTSLNIKQIASLIATVGVILVALSGGFSWLFTANASHKMNVVQEPRILSLETDSADYKTYWADAIADRKAQIAEAEAYCQANASACRGGN